MTTGETRHLWSGFWATSLGTLTSRVLGLVRDMATAALLGLGEGGVMDAFVIAFRIPNLLSASSAKGRWPPVSCRSSQPSTSATRAGRGNW